MTQKSRHLLDVTLASLLYKQSPCFTSGPSQQNQHDQTAERGHVYMFQNTVACCCFQALGDFIGQVTLQKHMIIRFSGCEVRKR